MSETLSASTAPRAAVSTGTDYIDALLAGSSYRWNAGSAYGTSVDLSYSFMTSAPVGADTSERTTFQAFDDAQKAGARAALTLYAEIANITLTEAADGALIDIRFANNDQSGASAGYAYYPTKGQVWLASDDDNNFDMTAGGYGYLTMLHEIGHALGLKHPGDYNATGGGGDPPYLSSDVDNYQYSIMSYNDAANGLYNVAPALYDIAAIQYLYGANTNTRSGDTTYTFETTATMWAIWDGGGSDTLDASNQTLGATIDLRAGAFSSIGALGNGGLAANNIAIAYGATIENAIGTAGDDTINGNGEANTIQGGAGNDTINGQGGNDTVVGGDGNDWLELGGSGTVSLGGVETLIGSSGSDWANLASGGNQLILAAIETLIGGADGDWINLGGRGNTMILAGIETLIGGSGSDAIRLGDRGNAMILAAVETLTGGGGSDGIRLGDRGNTMTLSAVETLIGGSGRDWINLGSGGNAMILAAIETLIGGSGSDAIRLGDRGNTMILAAVETLTGGGGTDDIRLGDRGNTMTVGGVEILTGGGGVDSITLTGGDGIRFQGGAGADTIQLNSGSGLDTLLFTGTGDGGAAGAATGWDEVRHFQSGTDLIKITGSLRTAVDHDGDGTVDSASRSTGTANLTTDDLIGLTVTLSSLADTDFSAFRTALGTVTTAVGGANALVVASDGTDGGLYLVSDDGNGSIASSEVRLLARFNGSTVAIGDVGFS